MKIAIFGATGRTGMEAVKRALANNHTVTAIVRWWSHVTFSGHPIGWLFDANLLELQSHENNLSLVHMYILITDVDFWNSAEVGFFSLP
jgi:putative NADH-flavin reductase